MKNQINKHMKFAVIVAINFLPMLAFASLEGAMYSLRTQLTTVFLPVLSLVGIVIAAISLSMGHHNAKNHIVMAVMGTIIGFGADGIIDFVRRTFGGV